MSRDKFNAASLMHDIACSFQAMETAHVDKCKVIDARSWEDPSDGWAIPSAIGDSTPGHGRRIEGHGADGAGATPLTKPVTWELSPHQTNND